MSGVSRSQFLINADWYSDLFPVVSTVSNTVNVAQKLFVLPKLQEQGVELNLYHTYLEKKPYAACLLAAVPVIGNIAVAIIEARWRANLAAVTSNPSLLERLIDRKDNPEFVRQALVVNPKVLEFIPTDLQGNWSYIKTIIHIQAFQEDHETMLDCLRKGGIEVFYDPLFPPKLKSDSLFLSRVLEKSFPRDVEFLADRHFMLLVAQAEPSLLSRTARPLKLYEDFWLAAYEGNKEAIKYLPDEPKGLKQSLFAFIRTSYPATPPPGLDQGPDPWAQHDSQASLRPKI